jgi:hypothetical protein
MELTKIDVLKIYGNQFLGFSNKVNFPKTEENNAQKTIIEKEIIENKVVETTLKEEILPKVEVSQVILPKEEVKTIVVPPIIKEEKIEKPVVKIEELPKIEKTENPVLTKFPFEGGTKIVWKMKKQSKLALVMEEEVFKNTLLMKALRVFLVEEIGINADFIGFGLFPKGTNQWNFEDMPVNLALLFGGKEYSEKEDIIANRKNIFLTFSLTDIVLEVSKQAVAKNTIMKIKPMMGESK